MEPQVNLKSWERRIPLGLIRRHNLSRTAVPGNVVLCAWTTLNSNLNFIASRGCKNDISSASSGENSWEFTFKEAREFLQDKMNWACRESWPQPNKEPLSDELRQRLRANIRAWPHKCTSGRMVQKSPMNTFPNLTDILPRRVEVVLTVKRGLTSHSTLFIRNSVSHTHTFVMVVLKAALYFWTCNSENVFSKGPQKYVGHTERQPLRAW